MDSERWRQIEQLYHAALARKPEHRHAFVVEACDSNDELIREVESLLAQDVGASSPLDVPAWQGAESLLGEPKTERLLRGTQLGPYKIEILIGFGGMGEVYRARDTRLGRDVAIKVLQSEFSSDPERRRRFEREARAAAMVNHPNITAVYDVGMHDGALYVVSELLEGETLRAHLKSRALPQRIALRYALDIAHGLDAAHQRGIVHRDLKPEKIFLTRHDVVKILDLGLAKFTADALTQAGWIANLA
jgi:eukaryotic-like serine/threonine-protein kinase